MTRSLLFFGVILTFSACVSNKKVVYFQKDDLYKRSPTDSVIRTYESKSFDYKIQPNDALYVRFESLTAQEYDFFKETQNVGSSRNYAVTSELVDPEGFILFPVIGKFKVSGLTVFEVQDSLQIVAAKYLESAVVKVRLVNFRFTVLGEVQQEGTQISYNNRVTLPEALGLAGGLSDLADRDNIKIIRQINGKTEVAYVDLLDEGFLNSSYYYIHQNDVLIVPALKQRPFRKYATQNLALFVSSLSLLLLIVNLTQ